MGGGVEAGDVDEEDLGPMIRGDRRAVVCGRRASVGRLRWYLVMGEDVGVG